MLNNSKMHNKKRLKAVMNLIASKKVDAFLVFNLFNIFYLTGLDIDNCILMVTPDKSYIFTDSRFKSEVEKISENFNIVIIKKNFSNSILDISRKEKIKKIAIESSCVTVDVFNVLKKNLYFAEIVFETNLVENFRLIKDEFEIKKIKKSVFILKKLCKKLIDITKDKNITEWDIACDLEFILKKEFKADFSFAPIIAAGVSSSLPHAKISHNKIKGSNFILFDLGVRWDNYCSDLTRLRLLSTMNSKQNQVKSLLIQHQQEIIDLIKPGKKLSEIDKFSNKKLSKLGYKENVLHSVGHGIGLEVHECPRISSESQEVAKPGMVITVEPGLYFPNEWGMRLEDLILVTQDGNEVLTKNIPKILE